MASSPGDHSAKIVVGDDVLLLKGYHTSRLRTVCCWILTVLTFGIFRLILYWNPRLFIFVTAYKCPLSVADRVLIRDEHMEVNFRPIRYIVSRCGTSLAIPSGSFQMMDVPKVRYFTCRKLMFVWDPSKMKFITPESVDCEVEMGRFHELAKNGLTDSGVLQRTLIYGKNLIDIKLKPILVLLFKEAITPFYIFQVFSVSIWFSDNYEVYATVIVLMSVISIAVDVCQTRSQEKNLRSMVHSSDAVEVIRNGGTVQKIGSEELVPGDVLIIPPYGCTMQCDAVLMNGTVIVNESMLTGESVPVTKVALPDVEDDKTLFSFKEHSRHILFCGTQILQTRYYGGQNVKAVVLRTAYSTLKGQLVRSIMYPKPVDFRFTKDLFKFIGFLSCIALCGFSYTVVIMISRGAPVKRILLRSLDIVTIVVPPALPAAMSIGMFSAQMRLRKTNIFCISPSTINTCGAINAVCFDKTGTLTEDGLDFHTIRPVSHKSSNGQPYFDNELNEIQSAAPNNAHLVMAISTCHSLTRINGCLCGDPLDLILFKHTGWSLCETVEEDIEETARFDVIQPTVVRSPPGFLDSKDETELAIIRQFTFSSSLQRMTVIVRNPKEDAHNMILYCKGAPEMIASLCRSNSVPDSYMTVVSEYAQHGYRLLAVAYRRLDISFVKAQKIKRELVECDLELLGLVVMENRLKPQTVGVIQQLSRAQIRTVMITGDNLFTAVSVARECQIIKPSKRAYVIESVAADGKGNSGHISLVLNQAIAATDQDIDQNAINGDAELGHLVNSSYQLAITGPTFAVICHEYPELLDNLVTVCDVFARMSPEQKQFLVNKLQELDYTVAMCGDGANDCAALKAAHAGISLSDAEASIAAPFTSKIADIRCVPMIIREGRAALVTSFGVVEYMAGYSLTQFITILHLYWINCNLTDFEFLFIDLGLVTLVAVFFGNTPASEKLSATPPPTRLLSLSSMLSVLGQISIVSVFQLFIFIYTTTQPWFIAFSPTLGDAKEDKRSMQGTALFCLSCFQYITLAVVYSRSFPYRKTLFSNLPLLSCLIALAILSVWMTLLPPTWLIKFMEFEWLPEFSFRLLILMVAVIYAVISFIYDRYFIQHLIRNVHERWKKEKRLLEGSATSSRFERILSSNVGSDPSWIFSPRIDDISRIRSGQSETNETLSIS